MLPKGGELPIKQSVSPFGRPLKFSEAEKGLEEKLLLRVWFILRDWKIAL